MRQYLGGKTHGDTLHALREKQREFHGKSDRLLLPAVVRWSPFRDLRAEHSLQGKLGESCLDVTWCGGRVAGEDIAPVALGVDKQFLLTELHKSVADGGITVWMVLHSVADNVGNLVKTSVVKRLHGM